MSSTRPSFGNEVAVQQAPIDVQAQIAGLGPALSVASAQVRGTVSAGPLDPTVLPALPAAARKWLGMVQPGETTVRASVAGSMQQGSAQAQIDMAPGSVALQGSWDADSVNVQKVTSTLTVQPSLVSALVGDSVSLSSPVPVQFSAGPVRMARSGASKFDAIPVDVQIASIAIAKAPALQGAASVQSVRVQGSVDPAVPPFVGLAHHRGDSVLRLCEAGSQGQAARADFGQARRQPARGGRDESRAEDRKSTRLNSSHRT